MPLFLYKMNFIRLPLLVLILSVFCVTVTVAQVTANDTLPKRDTVLPPTLVEKVQALMRQGAAKSRADYDSEKQKLKQAQLIEALQANIIKARGYLQHRLDTGFAVKQMHLMETWLSNAAEGIFKNIDPYISYRNLVTTNKMLIELEEKMNGVEAVLGEQERNLTRFKFFSDSLSADSSIYFVPNDSVEIVDFFSRFQYVSARLQPADSMLNKALSDIHILQGKANQLRFKLDGNRQGLESLQRQTSHTLLLKASPQILTNVDLPPKRSVELSYKKNMLLLRLYLHHHLGKSILILLLLLGATIFISSLKSIHKTKGLLQDDYKGQLILKYPILSAIVLVFNLFQFIFPDPPFVINLFCWTVAAFALTFIFREFITGRWMIFWISIVLLFLVAGVLNLNLHHTNAERVTLLVTAGIGIVINAVFLLPRHNQHLKEKLVRVFISLAILFEMSSIVTNLSGYFNLAKAFFICGYCNVVIGISFLWTIRLINEGLMLAGNVYTGQSAKLFYVNFNRVGTKAPSLLYFALIAAWFILMGRNFYEYQFIAQPLREFFITERTVGSYTFAISKVLTFFGVMILALIASKITSFFASERNPGHGPDTSKKKPALGSWLLLIRVMIISAGLFLALAASGFPIDRITILIGALGVGIGLGLQNLVNNLVSGLIIAFDRPVNVGDFVEVAGHIGTVKSIGFRSSVISSIDGADIVIPNGDLLNAHLVNWTLGGNRRRVTLPVSVAYGSDLEKVKTVAAAALQTDERVLEYPLPIIIFDEFGESSVNGKIMFWVKDYREAFPAKSAVLAAVHKAFRENDIHIPFPHREVYVHNKTDEKDVEN